MSNFPARRWALPVIALFAVALLIILGISSLSATNKVAASLVQPTPTVTLPSSTASRTSATPAQTQPSALDRRIGDEYLVLGDSVAFGVGASSPAQLGYAGVFYQDMKQLQPNLTYKNLAIPGETTASFLSRGSNKSQLDRALAEIDAAKAAGKRVSPITLTIGGNDVLAARNSSAAQKQTTIDSFDTNFKKILGQLAAHTDIGNTTDLIVTTYYNPFATSPGAQSQDELAWIQRFNDLIKQRASEYKARVADFYTPVLGHELEYTWISNGDIHPNVAGHAVLGGALWQMSGYTKEQS